MAAARASITLRLGTTLVLAIATGGCASNRPSATFQTLTASQNCDRHANSVVQPHSIGTAAGIDATPNTDRTNLGPYEVRPCVARLPQTDSETSQTGPGSVAESVSPAGPALQQGLPDATRPQATSAQAELPSSEEMPAPGAGASYQLDMSTALALVAGQNPQVGFARARVREAYANLEAANVLWLPTIQSGVSFNHHEGTLQDSEGAILEVSRSSLQSGLGAGAVGAGTTPQPGLVAQFQMIDAIFQPKIAGRTMSAQQHASNAVLNDQLLEAAVAYQELLRAYQLQAVAKESTKNTESLARQTEEFAKVGQGTLADADRSKAELALRRNAVARSEEQVAVAAARLAQAIGLRESQTSWRLRTMVHKTPLQPRSSVGLNSGRAKT